MSGGSDSGKRKGLDADDKHELECMRRLTVNLTSRIESLLEKVQNNPVEEKTQSDKQVITDQECHINRLSTRVTELLEEIRVLKAKIKEIEEGEADKAGAFKRQKPF
jgi:predicted RNase H-like nuclease (RuvC/YqgF family)